MQLGTLVRFSERGRMYRPMIEQGFDENSIFRIREVRSVYDSEMGDLSGEARNVYLETLEGVRVHREPGNPVTSVLATRLQPLSEPSVTDQGI